MRRSERRRSNVKFAIARYSALARDQPAAEVVLYRDLGQGVEQQFGIRLNAGPCLGCLDQRSWNPCTDRPVAGAKQTFVTRGRENSGLAADAAAYPNRSNR